MTSLAKIMKENSFLPRDLPKKMEKFPNLRRYIRGFGRYKGSDHIEKLTFFFKYLVNTYDLNVQEITGWDDDMMEEFYSWGGNSRWFRIFEPDMSNYPELYIPKAIELADKYGDINVEEILKSFGEK